jgi:hypothetical protein
MSTTAIAQNVTAPTGDIVMIEKNQSVTPGSLAILGLSATEAAALIAFLVAGGFIAANSGSGT